MDFHLPSLTRRDSR